MAALTWRNVDAPNFAPVQEGYRNFTNLLSNATTSLNEGIDRFRAQQQDQTDRNALAQSLQFNDADQLGAALRSGVLNTQGVSATALSSLGNRVNTLLDQAATRQQTAARQQAADRTAVLDGRNDNARGALAQSLGITDQSLAALSPDQQQELVRNRAALEGVGLNNDNRRFQNNRQAATENVRQSSNALVSDILSRSASADDARGNLEELRGRISPEEFTAVNAGLAQTFGNLYAPVGAPTPAAGGQGGSRVSAPAGSQGAGTANGSAYDATFNFQGTQAPISSMPISDVLNVQEASIESQGHSPMGAFQINKATLEDLGPKVLGENWQEQEFTPEVQEQLAKALFDERKGRDLTKTWASLPNSSPGAYKDYSWEEMRHILSLGETGQSLPDSPTQLRDLAARSTAEIGRRVAQNNSVDAVADVQRTMNDTSSPNAVANQLSEAFGEGAAPDLLRTIQQGMADFPGLSAAEVGAAIERAADRSSWWTPGTTTFGDGGRGVDDGRLRDTLAAFASGRTDYQAQANNDARNRGAAVQTAQQNLDSAVQELQLLQARQRTQPRVSTERAEDKVDRMTRALQQALSTQQRDPNLRPVRQ